MPCMCQNIDDFNRACALVFAVLYRAFPRPMMLNVADLDDGADLMDDERTIKLAERLEVAGASVVFLADEGYLTYRDARVSGSDARFSGARLTSKGLAALNRTPPALRAPGKTVGDTMIDLAKGLALDSAKDAVRAAVQAVLQA